MMSRKPYWPLVAFLIATLTACSAIYPESGMTTTADQQAITVWQDAWRELPARSGRTDIQVQTVQFSGTTGEVEYRLPSGARRIQLKDIKHSPNECAAWKISAADNAAGVEWRGICYVTYAARRQEASASENSEDWSAWTAGKDELVCELVNKKWTCSVGNGSMQSFIQGTN